MNQAHQLCTENASKQLATTHAPRSRITKSAVAINSINFKFATAIIKNNMKKITFKQKKKQQNCIKKTTTNTYSQEKQQQQKRMRIHTLHILNYYFFFVICMNLKKRKEK